MLRHLNEAMDQVRKAEYKRLTNRPDRTYIKGQQYVLLSHRENLTPEKRQRSEDPDLHPSAAPAYLNSATNYPHETQKTQ